MLHMEPFLGFAKKCNIWIFFFGLKHKRLKVEQVFLNPLKIWINYLQ